MVLCLLRFTFWGVGVPISIPALLSGSCHDLRLQFLGAWTQRWQEESRPIDILGIDCEPLTQSKPFLAARSGQQVEMWPGGLRVHVILGDWRDPAPIINAGVQQESVVVRIQIRWRLHIHPPAQEET